MSDKDDKKAKQEAEAPKASDVGIVGKDPRWPAMGPNMAVMPPTNEDEAAALNKHNEELRKAAAKMAADQVQTSDKK